MWQGAGGTSAVRPGGEACRACAGRRCPASTTQDEWHHMLRAETNSCSKQAALRRSVHQQAETASHARTMTQRRQDGSCRKVNTNTVEHQQLVLPPDPQGKAWSGYEHSTMSPLSSAPHRSTVLHTSLLEPRGMASFTTHPSAPSSTAGITCPYPPCPTGSTPATSSVTPACQQKAPRPLRSGTQSSAQSQRQSIALPRHLLSPRTPSVSLTWNCR